MRRRNKYAAPAKKKGALFWMLLTGIAAGFANGLFGSGGGVLAVPLLERTGMPQQKTHATALAVMLPLSVVSLFLYSQREVLPLQEYWPLLPAGLAGALLGGIFLKRISGKWLKRLFGGLLVLSAVRLFLA